MSIRTYAWAASAAILVLGGLGCAPSTTPTEGGNGKPDDTTKVASNSEGGPGGAASTTSEESPAGPSTSVDVKAAPGSEGKESDAKSAETAPAAPPNRGGPPGSPGGQGGPVRPSGPGGPGGPGGGRGFGGGFGRGGGGSLFMLANDQIKKELGISDEQSKKLQALMPAPGGPGGPGGGPGGGPNAGGGRSPEEMQKQREEMQKKVDAILTDAQKTRMKEIQYQLMGSRAFTNPEVVKVLGITEAQSKELEALNPQRGQGAQGGGGGQGGSQMTPEERQKRREERMKKSLEVLTDAQRAKWQKMIGKPFEFQFQPRGGGGNRGGGGAATVNK